MDLFARGLDIALVMFTHRGGSRLVITDKVKRIADFKGKSVLIPHKLSIQHMLLHKFLDAKGILGNNASSNTVSIEPVPPILMPEMITMDKAEVIAGFIGEDPFAIQAVARGPARQLLATCDLWPDHPGSAFVVRRNLLKTRAEDIAILVRCFFRCAESLDANLTRGKKRGKKENIDLPSLAANFLKQPRNIAAMAFKKGGSTYPPASLVPDSGMLEIIRHYMGETMGLLSSFTNLDNFIEPDFARNALGELDI